MRLPVRLPQFGESAAEATIVAWLVQPGATVRADQELVEVQTEKSLLTVAAPCAGVLAEQRALPGATVAVGAVLAELEVAAGTPVPESATAEAPDMIAAPAIAPSKPQRATMRGSSGDHLFLSPRVRALMEEHGLKASDLSAISGTGAGGRISAQDIERYLSVGEPMSPVRQAVAASMTRSWTRPLATVARAVRMDALLTHRRTIAGRPSATVYAAKALAMALKAGSPLACRLYANRLVKVERIDIGIAVEITDGVLTPALRAVDQTPLAELTTSVDDLITRAQAGRVGDLGEPVSTVSNYGTFGLTWATPIPLPGQATILGMGAVEYVPDWDPTARTWGRCRRAEFTLTFDHRLADGGDAARLLNRVAELIEHPERLG